MPMLAVAAVGAMIGGAIGGTVLGVSAAAIGWSVGGMVGSLLFRPDGPRADLQETRAAKLQFGAKIPRLYGRARLPLNPRWTSKWRATSQSAGGKGGGGGSKYYTYAADGLFWVCANGLTGIRLWENNKLIWTSAIDATLEDLTNSSSGKHFSAITFYDGNMAQLPWPVYEAAVGTANADAHRGIFCVAIENYQAGTNAQWGFLEVEVITKGTLGTLVDASDGLLCHFDALSAGGAVVSAVGPDMALLNGAALLPTGGLFTGGGEVTAAAESFLASGVGGTLGNSWRFECFVKPSGFLGQVFSIQSTVTGHHIEISYPAAFSAFLYNISSIISTGGGGIGAPANTLIENQWNHLAVQWRSDTQALDLFCNGVFVATFGSGVFFASTDMFDRIQVGGVSSFSGMVIDEVYMHVDLPATEYYGATYAVPSAPFPGGDLAYSIWTALPEDLADIVEAECTRCGLPAGKQNHSELVGIPVTGIVLQNSGRDSCEQLAAGYYFGATCREKLYTRLRGAVAVATIVNDNTGAAENDAADPFTGVDRGNDQEVPAHWIISSPDIENDYETGTEESPRVVTKSVEKRHVPMSIVFTPQERKGRATAFANDARVGSHAFGIAVDNSHAKLEPFDVVMLYDEDGNLVRGRLMQESYANDVKQFEGAQDDQLALPFTASTANPYVPSFTVSGIGAVDGTLLDTAIARDVDDEHGLYWVSDFSGGASAASLFKSPDNTTFTSVADSTSNAITGTAKTVLGNHLGGNVFDEVNTVRVEVSGPLTASSYSAMLLDNTINAAELGIAGRWERLRFRTPTLVSLLSGVYTYTLSGLLRGLDGTEQTMPSHAVGDKFILMRPDGLTRVSLESSEVGIVKFWKHVVANNLVSSVPSTAFANTAAGKKPYAPVDGRVSRDASGNAVLTCVRRTRLAHRITGPLSWSIPLGETTEKYHWIIYTNSSYTTVARDLGTTLSASVNYSAADQTTDFGSQQTTIYAKVSQVSETVGDGYYHRIAA